MIQGIDHVVIAVRDLQTASNDYRNAGFTVTPGGEHVGGATHNALVSFGDGAYFELIAFREPDRDQDHKWWPKFRRGEGTVDFALLSDDLTAEAERLRQAGVAVDGPRDGGRARPDGVQLAWKSLNLSSGDVPLPFVIEDVTAHDLRVPPGEATRHPLNITGVAGVTILVPHLDAAIPVYAALLGTPGESASPEITGSRRGHRFSLGTQWIELAEPAPDATDLRQHLRERGAAPYEIVLQGEGENRAPLPTNLTHGARIQVGGPAGTR